MCSFFYFFIILFDDRTQYIVVNCLNFWRNNVPFRSSSVLSDDSLVDRLFTLACYLTLKVLTWREDIQSYIFQGHKLEGEVNRRR